MTRMLGILFLFYFSCTAKPELPGTLPYEIESPDKTYILPDELLEISGVTWIGPGIIGCVEDNTGRVFYYDLNAEKIYHVESITGEGDFEGIATTGASLYLLRSDGTLFEWDKSRTREIDTFLEKKNDTEGLCYDSLNNRLIIACKEDSPDGNENERAFFAYDLSSGQLMEKPAWTIALSQFKEFFGERAKDFRFKPSGIALSPVTNEFYIISSTGKILIVTDHQGKVKDAAWLPENMFPQPEGICFSPEGDLFISTEGKGLVQAKIFRYKLIR